MTSYRFEVGTTVLCNLGELVGSKAASSLTTTAKTRGQRACSRLIRWSWRTTVRSSTCPRMTTATAVSRRPKTCISLDGPMPLPRQPSMLQHTRCPRVADLATSAAKGALLHRSRATAKVGVSAVTIVRGLGLCGIVQRALPLRLERLDHHAPRRRSWDGAGGRGGGLLAR